MAIFCTTKIKLKDNGEVPQPRNKRAASRRRANKRGAVAESKQLYGEAKEVETASKTGSAVQR